MSAFFVHVTDSLPKSQDRVQFTTLFSEIFNIEQINVEIGNFFSKDVFFAQDSEFEVEKSIFSNPSVS